MTEEILTDFNNGFVLLIEINKSRRDLHLHSSFLLFSQGSCQCLRT